MASNVFGGVRQLFSGQLLYYQIYFMASCFTMLGMPICLMLGKWQWTLFLAALLVVEYFGFDDWLNKTELHKHVAKEGKVFHDAKVFHSEFSQEMVIPVSKKSPLNPRPIEFTIEDHPEYKKAYYLEMNCEPGLEELDPDFDAYGIRKPTAKSKKLLKAPTGDQSEKKAISIPVIPEPEPEPEPEILPIAEKNTKNTSEKKESEEPEEDVEELDPQPEDASKPTTILEKKQQLQEQLHDIGISSGRKKKT